MAGQTHPPDEVIQKTEDFDRLLRADPRSGSSDEIPTHVVTGLRFLHHAYQSIRSSQVETTAAIGQPTVVQRPNAVGRFGLLEQLGSGSFGVVYRAIDTVLEREVALKIPRLVTALSDELSDRFLRESQAAARLRHPNIIPVYEAGSVDQTTYIAAEYCPGITLEEWLKDNPVVEPRRIGKLILNLADAVEHAHQAGILHRDLKPGNIMLKSVPDSDARSDPAILDQAMITDFGLARFIDEGQSTQMGLVGTIAYMSPEQAGGEKDLGPECDVYSLGVILYEMLTGSRPHVGENHMETLRLIWNEVPASPRHLCPEIPRDLESICLCCLEKEPERRYRTAAALRDDLQRFLDDRPTVARPLSIGEQLIRGARRYPAVAGAFLAMLLIALVAMAGVSYHFRQLATSIKETNEQRRIAELREKQIAGLLYAADMRVALIALQQGDWITFEKQLVKYEDRPELRGVEWEFLKSALPHPIDTVKGHDGPIYSSAFSPDESLLATVGKDHVLRLWDLPTHTLKAEFPGHTDEINDVAFHPDGTMLATSSDDRTVRIWDMETSKELHVLEHPDGVVFGVAFSPDGQFLVSGGITKHLRVWSLTGSLLEELGDYQSDIDHLVFSRDGKTLAVATGLTVELWNPDGWKKEATLTGPGKPVVRAAFSGDGNLVAASSWDKKIHLWDRNTGKRRRVFSGHQSRVLDVKFTCNDGCLMSSGEDGTVRVWEIASPKFANETRPAARGRSAMGMRAFRACDERVWTATPFNGGRQIVTTGNGGEICFWDGKEGRYPRFGFEEQDVIGIELDTRAKTLVVNKTRAKAAVWNVTEERIREKRQPFSKGLVASASISSDDRWVAFQTIDSRVVVEDLKDSSKRRSLPKFEGNVACVEFSPTSPNLLMISSHNGLIRLVDVATDEVVKLLKPGGEMVFAVFSPDGKFLASNNDSELLIWNCETWKVISRFPTRHKRAIRMAFSRDGKQLVTAHRDRVLLLYDLSSNEPPRPLAGHHDLATGVVFSKDGRTLFSSSADGTVRAWHVASAQEMGKLFQDDVFVCEIELSSDGRKLFAGHSDGALKSGKSGLLMWEAAR